MNEIICQCGQTLSKGNKYYEIEGEIWCENCIDQYINDKERIVGEDD